MTTTHHPSEALLLDYASGALAEPMALLIASHATLCPACRADIARFEHAAGTLLETLESDEAPADDAATARLKSAIMDALDAPEPATVPSPAVPSVPAYMPAPLRRYVGAAVNENNWRRWGPGVQQIRLLQGRSDATVRLARIQAGAQMPDHAHRGEEFTLVLAGGFSDATGHFLRGDVAEMGPEDIHQPVADTDGDCICLIVSSAPLRLRGLVGTLLNPFIRD
jgi:putative transcriptional regulator